MSIHACISICRHKLTRHRSIGLKVHPRALLLPSPLTKAKRLRNRARHIAKLIVYVYTRMHIYMQTHTNPTPLGLKVHPRALMLPSPLAKIKRFRNRKRERRRPNRVRVEDLCEKRRATCRREQLTHVTHICEGVELISFCFKRG